jgi:hypothetical protein
MKTRKINKKQAKFLTKVASEGLAEEVDKDAMSMSLGKLIRKTKKNARSSGIQKSSLTNTPAKPSTFPSSSSASASASSSNQFSAAVSSVVVTSQMSQNMNCRETFSDGTKSTHLITSATLYSNGTGTLSGSSDLSINAQLMQAQRIRAEREDELLSQTIENFKFSL